MDGLFVIIFDGEVVGRPELKKIGFVELGRIVVARVGEIGIRVGFVGILVTGAEVGFGGWKIGKLSKRLVSVVKTLDL